MNVTKLSLLAAVSSIGLAGVLVPAAADAQTAAAPAAEASTLEQVVVTARRRAENLQKTPVSVTAVSAVAVERAGIHSIDQLAVLVPGLNFSNGSSKGTTVYSIRGMSRVVAGNAQPAVVAYFNEVPTPFQNSMLPTYDVENVQVLKGPQGTLFGRNTSAGAVLVSSRKPTDELGGWGQVTLGNYNSHEFQGAVNLPIIEGKADLRVAADIWKRDGYTKNMSFPGYDMDNRDDKNYRVSLLVRPIDSLQNLLVYDHADSHDRVSNVFYQYVPGQTADRVAYLNGTLLSAVPTVVPCGGLPICSAQAAYLRQNAAGPRKAWMDFMPVTHDQADTVTNTTTWNVNDTITLKNIFGYRHVLSHVSANTDGWEAAAVMGDAHIDISQYSDELQLSGKALDNKLTWITGLFWLKSKPTGGNLLTVQTFAQPGTAPTSTLAAPRNGAIGPASFYTDTSKAIYGQVNYDLSGLSDSLHGFSVDAGLRYTKDTDTTCIIPGISEVAAIPGPSDCPASSNLGTSSNRGTYTFGLNWQATSDILAYAVTRKGYRAGGVNTPKLGGTLVPFQTWAPEIVHDIEIGLKSDWRFNGILARFNIAAFQSKYDGLQASQTVTAATNLAAGPDGDFNPANNPNTVIANFGKAEVKGIETELTVSPVQGLELSANGAWLNRKITALTVQFPNTFITNNTPAGLFPVAFIASPDYSYNLGANYTWKLADNIGDLVFDARYFKIGTVYYGAVRAKPYDRLDFNVSWNNVMASHIDATAFVTNAADTTGITAAPLSSNGLGFTSAYYEEPRMYGVKLRYAFGGESRY